MPGPVPAQSRQHNSRPRRTCRHFATLAAFARCGCDLRSGCPPSGDPAGADGVGTLADCDARPPPPSLSASAGTLGPWLCTGNIDRRRSLRWWGRSTSPNRCRPRSTRAGSTTPTSSPGRAGAARHRPRASWPARSTASRDRHRGRAASVCRVWRWRRVGRATSTSSNSTRPVTVVSMTPATCVTAPRTRPRSPATGCSSSTRRTWSRRRASMRCSRRWRSPPST